MNKDITKLMNTIEEQGWTIDEEGDNQFRIGKFSPYDQDFSIAINGETKEELIEDIYSNYEEFDVSYETYLWLDDEGHGRNGAPYDMKDLYEDMEECKNMIKELYSVLTR